ncbi:MAG: hypothetical protein J0L77_00835 [Alphaproteobacteria bacterium]|nr:hypothetical protein [Alphaproteobacteria bacterium]
MMGLEVMAGGLLYLAAADIECRPRKIPTILITPLRTAVSYNFTKSREELGNFDIDTISPYGTGHNVKVGGLMEGEIRIESRVAQVQETYKFQKQACVHLDNVTIIVHSDPVIYVAREYAKGSCEQKAVIDHEKRHVDIDRAIVNEFSKTLENRIRAHLRQTGYVFGPFPVAGLPERQKKIQASLEKIIKDETAKMTATRQKRQQALDNADEYERVRLQCAGR